MKIAVLMSTYNGSKFLEKQLKSIQEQTLKDCVDIYIRDDGSRDDTLFIIQQYQKLMNIHLVNGKNAGPALSFWELFTNKNIKADYFLFCDQDDIWDANKIEECINKLKDKTHLCICNSRIIDQKDKVISKERLNSPPEISIPRLFVSGVAQGCAMAFTKELRDYIISLHLKCIPMHDIIVMLYAISYGQVCWIQQPLFSYRFHDNNVVAKQNKKFFKKIMTTLSNWRNSSVHSMQSVAKELLSNSGNISEDDFVFLTTMSNYKKSIKNKLRLMVDKRINNVNRDQLRSYRIRILLNLL